MKNKRMCKMFTTCKQYTQAHSYQKNQIRMLTNHSNKKMSKDEKVSKKKDVLKKVGWFALKTTAISGAVLGGAALAVPALGFTAGGVAAGSLAAAYQSAVLGGTIASGSAFAVLQSVGAVGLAASTQAAVVAASAVTAGAHSVLKEIKRKKDGEDNSCDCEKEKKVCSCAKVRGPKKENSGEANTCKCGKDKVRSSAKVEEQKECLNKEEHESSDECDCYTESTASRNNQKKNEERLKLETFNARNDVLQETSQKSVEKWKNLQLTDDVTITQNILRKNKY